MRGSCAEMIVCAHDSGGNNAPSDDDVELIGMMLGHTVVTKSY